MLIAQIHNPQPKQIYNDCLDSFVIDYEKQRVYFENQQPQTFILAIDPDTGREKFTIDSSGSERHLTVSADGAMFAFVSDRSGNDEIWISKSDTSEYATRVTNFGDDSNLEYPNWHPTSEKLLVLRTEDSQTELLEVNAKTGESTLLVRGQSRLGPAIYSPYSNEIISSHSIAGTSNQLLFVRANGEVDYTSIRGNHPRVLNDKTVAFSGNRQGDLMTIDADRVVQKIKSRQFSYYNYGSWDVSGDRYFTVPPVPPVRLVINSLDGDSSDARVHQFGSSQSISHLAYDSHSDTLFLTILDTDSTDIAYIHLEHLLSGIE